MIDLLTRILLPIVTFFVGTYVQAARTQHSDLISQINEIIKEIETARDFATDYWVFENADTSPAQAIKVRSALHLIGALASDEVLGSEAGGFDELFDDLHEHATGGTFETADRGVDPGRAFECRMTAADLIALLRRRRGEVNGSTYVFVEGWRATKTTLMKWFQPYRVGRLVGRLVRNLRGPK